MPLRADPAAEAQAQRVARAFVDAFSARDDAAQRETMNFPHVRLASGRVLVWDTPEDFVTPFDRLAEREGWDRSTLDAADPVHSTRDKVHLAVTFSRYGRDGERYAEHHALWVVTNQDGHWGIQARSSFAP